MQRGYSALTRIAGPHLLAHERANRELRRYVKAIQYACLGLAALGTMSTAAAWQDRPARAEVAHDRSFSGGEAIAPTMHEGPDLSAFVQFAGR